MDNFRRTFNTTPTVVSRTARVVFSNKLVPNVVTNQFGGAYYAALIKGDTKQCDISETSTDTWEVPYNSSWYWDVDAYCDILLYTNYSDGSQDVTTIDTDVLLRIRYNEWYNNFTLSRGSDDGHFYIHADFEPTSITGLTGYPELNGVQVSYPSLYSPTNANIRIDQYLSIDPQIFDSQDSMQYVFELDKTDPDNPKLYISKIRADYLTYRDLINLYTELYDIYVKKIRPSQTQFVIDKTVGSTASLELHADCVIYSRTVYEYSDGSKEYGPVNSCEDTVSFYNATIERNSAGVLIDMPTELVIESSNFPYISIADQWLNVSIKLPTDGNTITSEAGIGSTFDRHVNISIVDNTNNYLVTITPLSQYA